MPNGKPAQEMKSPPRREGREIGAGTFTYRRLRYLHLVLLRMPHSEKHVCRNDNEQAFPDIEHDQQKKTKSLFGTPPGSQ